MNKVYQFRLIDFKGIPTFLVLFYAEVRELCSLYIYTYYLIFIIIWFPVIIFIQ